MRSTSVWVAFVTIDGALKPTVGIKTREDVDGRGVEGISACTSLDHSALSTEARTTSSVFSVFSEEESASVSDDFFVR
jgi:hypothetical protein